MVSAIISRLVILVFGTLYPAYASYKAVRTKNVREYVKWMMYWIVFALFTCAETFTDVFLSFWFPFYYEFKILIVIWLLSPATRGSSILYRNFVHPSLIKREQEIDEYISKAREQGYHTMLQLGSRGVTYATNVIMQTAIKGGGGLVNHLRRSYSLSDITDEMDPKADLNRNSRMQADTVDSANVPRDARLKSSHKPGGSHVDLYFPEMDVDFRSRAHHPHELPVSLGQIRSNEDVSSGYSSAEPLFAAVVEGEGEGHPLMRTASVGGSRARPKSTRAAAQPKKLTSAEGDEEELLSAHDWSHSFPPLLLQALLPELQKLAPENPSPQALLTPRVLKLIYENSMSRKNTPYKLEVLCEGETSCTEIDVNNDGYSNSYTDVGVELVNPNNKNTYTNNDVAESTSTAGVEKPETTLTILVPNSGDVIITSDKVEVTSNIKDDDTNINVKEYISNEEIDECFEDAVEATLSVKLDPQIFTYKEECLQSTNSLESVASSDDHQFEDSLDVSLVNENESENAKDRGGKYNKGRAPFPPGVNIPEDLEETIQLPRIKTIVCEPVQSTESNSNIQFNPMNDITSSEKTTENDDYLKERSVSPYWSKKDRSPSPKQAKKDGSNFSRFLPKAGVTSLFNFLSTKDEGGSGNRTSVSRSSSNASRKSPSPKFFSSSDSSNVDPTMYFNETATQNNENVGTPSKLKLRQMSQSPSRRRQN